MCVTLITGRFFLSSTKQRPTCKCCVPFIRLLIRRVENSPCNKSVLPVEEKKEYSVARTTPPPPTPTPPPPGPATRPFGDRACRALKRHREPKRPALLPAVVESQVHPSSSPRCLSTDGTWRELSQSTTADAPPPSPLAHFTRPGPKVNKHMSIMQKGVSGLKHDLQTEPPSVWPPQDSFVSGRGVSLGSSPHRNAAPLKSLVGKYLFGWRQVGQWSLSGRQSGCRKH